MRRSVGVTELGQDWGSNPTECAQKRPIQTSYRVSTPWVLALLCSSRPGDLFLIVSSLRML